MRSTTVLLITPDHFEITYSINPHMLGTDGEPNKINRALARSQWFQLKENLESLGCRVLAYPSQPGFPDMVFCANQTFPYVDSNGRKKVILSQMRHPQRQGEVFYFRKIFESLGYEIQSLPDGHSFEGMGDLIKKKNLDGSETFFGGYGYRTQKESLERIEKIIDRKIIQVRLVSEDFYHLDTCLCILNSKVALVVEKAFDPKSLEAIRGEFEDILWVDPQEARTFFTANAYSPDGHHILLQKGASQTISALKKRGFHPIEIDTSEYIKAGGSVFCLKLELP